MTSETIAMIGVPSSMGAFVPGQEQAPAALRAAGLVGHLEAEGFAVADEGDPEVRRWVPDRASPKAQHVEAVVEVASSTAQRVRGALARGAFPLVLGGDCTVGLGTIAAFAAEPPFGVVYFDLHTDMNVPASVREGALDWMGMAHALGFEGADPRLVSFGPRTPLIGPDDVIFFAVGPDHPTSFEREQQEARGLREVDCPSVAADPEGAAVEALRSFADGRRVIVHFDVDTVDFMDLPISENAGRNEGLSFDRAIRALGAFLADPRVAALTVTEVNPAHDPDGSAIDRLVDGLARSLGRLLVREVASP